MRTFCEVERAAFISGNQQALDIINLAEDEAFECLEQEVETLRSEVFQLEWDLDDSRYYVAELGKRSSGSNGIWNKQKAQEPPMENDIPELLEDDILDTDQVAAMLGCSTVTVDRKARSGELPAFRFGNGGWKFTRKTLIDALHKRASDRADARTRNAPSPTQSVFGGTTRDIAAEFGQLSP